MTIGVPRLIVMSLSLFSPTKRFSAKKCLARPNIDVVDLHHSAEDCANSGCRIIE